MAVYDQLWHTDVAPKMNSRLLMTQLLYLAPNDRYDQLMADLRSADGDTLAKVNNGDRLAMRNLLHLDDLPLLARFAKQRLGA